MTVCVPRLGLDSVNCARPPESDAVRGAPPSTLSETIPVGVPALELTVTVTRALDGKVTGGALMRRLVGLDDPEVDDPELTCRIPLSALVAKFCCEG